MPDPVDLIYQELLDEHNGNLVAALREACQRLHSGDELAARLSREVTQWRRGASWAYLRRKRDADPKPIDDVPTPITDEWIATGKEA